MAKQIVLTTLMLVTVAIVAFVLFTHNANAQDDAAAADSAMVNFKALGGFIVEGIVFSIVGLIILMVGYKVFDMATPYDLNRQIAEENNTAAGVAVAGVLISLGIIVAAAMG
jgi:membrane protein implicated in regulation of membrane protease activity